MKHRKAISTFVSAFLIASTSFSSGCNSPQGSESKNPAPAGVVSCGPTGIQHVSTASTAEAGSTANAADNCASRQTTLEGTLEVYSVLGNAAPKSTQDNSQEASQETIRYYLVDAQGSRHELQFLGDKPTYESGTPLRVHGAITDCISAQATSQSDPAPTPTLDAAGMSSLSTITLTIDDIEAADAQAMVLPYALGAQNIAVILVNFSDKSSAYTQALATDVVFNQVNNYWMEASFGKTWATGRVFGPYAISISSAGCDSNAIANAAKAAVQNAGESLVSYKRIVYAFPQNGCSWLGLGSVGGSSTQAWLNNALNLHTSAHELGHNLGLYHANALNCGTSASIGSSCSTVEYGDPTDTMGNKTAGHYSSFQKERLGWLNGADTPTIQTVSASGSFALEPFETDTRNVKALKVVKSTDSSGRKTYYYLEYRQPIGVDALFTKISTSNNITKGVIIHTGSEATGNSSLLINANPTTGSVYQAALTPGKTFTDSSAGVSISVVSADANGAVVTVAMGTQPVPTCTRARPTLALTPTASGSALAGTTLTYNVQLTNTDSSACSSSSFNLAATVPSGFRGTFPSTTMSLSPGTTGRTTLQVTSASTSAAGNYNIAVTATDAGATSGTANAASSYTVTRTPTLNLALVLNKLIYSLGEQLQMRLTVTNGGTPAAGASYQVMITEPNGTQSVQEGTIDSTGGILATYQLSSCAEAGTYQVGVIANLDGKSVQTSSSFTMTVSE